MDEYKIVYKCVGYFKNRFCCYMKNGPIRAGWIDENYIDNIYIALKDGLLILLINKDFLGSTLLCSYSNFVTVFHCNYRMLLLNNNIIELNNYYE